MGKLLFTEDELHRSFKFFEEEERPKAEAVKQYKYNESALKWLRTVYHEKAERKLTTEEVLSHPVTIADAFRWYSSYQRKQFSENQTEEARDILREAQRGESICEMISYKPQELKAILWDYALIQVAEKALKCWNDVLPFKTVQDQQQAAAPAADQEQSNLVAFEILQKMYDSATEQDRKYFHSNRGRRKKGVPAQDIYFEPALRQFNTVNKGGLEMSTFLKIVGRFKKSLNG